MSTKKKWPMYAEGYISELSRNPRRTGEAAMRRPLYTAGPHLTANSIT